MDTNNKRVIPINRVNKWFSNEDFDYQISLGREAIEGFNNFVVILYRVDRTKTQVDDIYGEGAKDGIRFYPPVELKVMYTIEEPENKTYDKNGTSRVQDDGLLTFEIYDAQLQELDTEISYGDYVAFPVDEYTLRYYSVANDGVKNFDDAHMILGYKPALRTIICTPVDPTEFSGF